MFRCAMIAMMFFSLTGAVSALAASPPDAGTFLREQRESPVPALPMPKPPPEHQSPDAADQAGAKLLVREFVFEGVTIFTPEELREELVDLIGRELTMKQLEAAPQRIIAFYGRHGRIVSAFLPRQEVKQGLIVIRVIEAKLGAVSIDPASKCRLNPDLALEYLHKENKSGELINKESLEEAVRLLKGLPGVSASTTLVPGKERGTSDLLVRLSDTPYVTGSLETDNQGSRSSGEYRGTAAINLNNPFGIGDQISFRSQTTWDNNYGRVAYTLPAGVTGGQLTLSTSDLHYDLGAATQAKGDAFTVGANGSLPLLRGHPLNLSLQTAYEFRLLYNEAHRVPLSNKQLHSVSVGFEGNAGDKMLGGGFTTLSVGFGGGYVDLSGDTANLVQDQTGQRSNGYFGKLLFSGSRTQTIEENKTSLSFSMNGQYSPAKNLDSSEQFSLGGFSGVRAYPTSEATGDSGFVASVELRHMLFNTLQASIFYDIGWIMLHAEPWSSGTSSTIPNEYSLDGVGAGLAWTPAAWCVVKGIVADRVRNSRGADAQGHDSDGSKREPRFWFLATMFF